MAKLFTNSYIRPVYYQAGKVDGKDVFRRAPFDAVVLDGNVYVQPTSYGSGGTAIGMLANDSAEDVALWRQDIGGYHTLEPIVVNECQMGDGCDNWIGLHAISNI